MKTSNKISKQTQNNWLVDAGLLVAGISVAASSVYFLFLPDGGYRGGRNPYYGLQIIFDRHTWDDFHTWAGIGLMAFAAVHLVLHWPWVANMAKRTWNELTGRCGCMNSHGRWNLILNTVVALSFLLAAISSLYFLFLPGGRGQPDSIIFLSRSTWDLLHTWAGVAWISATVVHFAIHWKWVTKVTGKMLRRVLPAQPVSQPTEAAG